ncbi:MAG: response regulator transcription factor, partial [Giesbergeria sp.]|nr:response regulator transcription factor [Giesbergeria sp.]
MPSFQPPTTRILLADDHQMFREALCHLLQTQSDLEVVGQTGDGAQVLALAQQCSPGIVCMDISMPGMEGP